MAVTERYLQGLAERLRDVDIFLDRILDGEKPVLDPDDRFQASLIAQVHAFYPDDFDQALNRSLDSRPQAYYITPDILGSNREKLRQEVSTKVHPLHENLINSNEIFLRNCSKLNGIHNVVVAGADLHFRDRRDYQKMFERSENLYLHKRGDVVSLSQTVKLLRNIVEGQDSSERAIVIDNSSGRFTPVLSLLGISDDEGVNRLNDALEKTGARGVLGIIDTAGTSIGKLNEIGFHLRRKLPVLPALFADNLFFDTSSDEKINDTVRALRANRSDIVVQHANLLAGHSEHDPEFTWSFAGNALAKGVTTVRRQMI